MLLKKVCAVGGLCRCMAECVNQNKDSVDAANYAEAKSCAAVAVQWFSVPVAKKDEKDSHCTDGQ